MSADSRGASNCEEGGLGDCFGEYTVFKKYQKMENSVQKPCGMRKIRVFVKLSESGVSLRKIFLKIYNLFILF